MLTFLWLGIREVGIWGKKIIKNQLKSSLFSKVMVCGHHAGQRKMVGVLGTQDYPSRNQPGYSIRSHVSAFVIHQVAGVLVKKMFPGSPPVL